MFRFALFLLPAWLAAAAPVTPRPGTALSLAPPAPVAQVSTPPVQGLRGDYYNGRNFERKVLSRVDRRLDFHWRPGQAVGPGIDQEAFSVRWTGKLYTPSEGTYNFIVNADNGVRVWVDGKLLIAEWHVPVLNTFRKETRLAAGRYYDLRIEYTNYEGPAIFRLAWEYPKEGTATSGLPHYTPEAVIPARYLFMQPPPPPQRPRPATPLAPDARDTPVRQTPSPDRATAGTPTGLPGNKVEKKRGAAPKAAVVKAETPRRAAGKREETGQAAPRETATFESLEPGRAVVLEEVLFEQSQYRLLPASYAQLDKLAGTLRKYPRLSIEVAGHTDNVGDPRLNQALSEHRALVVTHYLQRQGVAENRLRARGYGGTRPVAPNTTETDRARNRRVEFTVRTDQDLRD